MPLTVLIVDDHEGFRQVARALLEAAGIRVVGEAADGESAITQAERLRPQLDATGCVTHSVASSHGAAVIAF